MSIAAPLSMSYECQIGEKPGSPQYSFKIADGKVHVTKNIAKMNPPVRIEWKGTLEKADGNSLSQILSSMPRLPKWHLHDGITGIFSLQFKLNQTDASYTGPSNDAIDALEPLMRWIKAFHAKHSQLKAVAALAPGDPESSIQEK